MSAHYGFVVVCCVCKRVRSKNGRWYRRRNIPESVSISHTYCPTCARKAMDAINVANEKIGVEG
jgi:hypothetical protein